MFAKIAVSALFAGFGAGLITALLQLVFVQPVLLHAELYEGGDLVHFGAAAVSAHQEVGGFDPVRDGLSILFTAAIYTGYAFILVAGMALAAEAGQRIDARTGMVWGLAGFVAVHLAPAFGLPPEVPGVAAAEVTPRQVWWWATVAASILGIALISFGGRPVLWAVGALALVAPHLVGAPHPDAFAGAVPPELAALFAGRALGVGLAAWVVLGLLAGYFWQREKNGVAQSA